MILNLANYISSGKSVGKVIWLIVCLLDLNYWSLQSEVQQSKLIAFERDASR